MINQEVTMCEPQPSPSGSVPQATRRILPPKKQLSTREKQILVNVYNVLEKSSATYPSKMELYKRTSEIMGVSLAVVQRTVKHYQNTNEIIQRKERPANRSIIDRLDEFILSAIRMKVHQFYINGDLPTIEKVLKLVNDDDRLPCFSHTTMYRILKKLNFSFSKQPKKS